MRGLLMRYAGLLTRADATLRTADQLAAQRRIAQHFPYIESQTITCALGAFSGRSRPLIPEEAEHVFQLKPNT